MNENTQSRLESLKYYGTAYEVVLVNHETKATYRLAYTGRKGWKGITNATLFEGSDRYLKTDAIERITGSRMEEWIATKVKSFTNAGWEIKFSGRTQREAITSGEHPYILAV